MSADLPLVEEISPAPEPCDAFLRLATLPYALFFDSVTAPDEHARFSYVAARPFVVITAKDGVVDVLEEEDETSLAAHGYHAIPTPASAPLAALAHALDACPADRVNGLPPFQGGAAGLLGYGLARSLERLPPPRADEFAVPDLVLGLYDWVVAFDHERGTCHVVAHGYPASGPAARARLAAGRLRELRALLARGGARGSPRRSQARLAAPLDARDLAPAWPVSGKNGLLSSFSREDYVAAVRRAIDYVHAGDVFQVNLSQRLLYPQTCDPVDFYLRLREANPAPFSAYFDIGRFVIASSSPEQFLSLHDRAVTTRPIKGTRSRGYSPEEDIYRRDLLVESEKDRAENVMIVDLLRNDISRVSRPGSVVVPRLCEVERYATVHHLVSEVRGVLREGAGAVDLLRAAFPGGSVTGAPKIRAMEIIAEIERTARGAYCGSLGWISFAGDMGTSILIRTLTLGRGWLQLPVGGGIVADSDPEAEYDETMAKAAGMVRALG